MAWTVYPQCPIRDTEYVGIYVDILVDIKSMWKFFPERFCFGLFYLLGWPKCLFGFFHKMLQKNPNERFGQANISLFTYLFRLCGVLVAACRIFIAACGLLVVACMWDLVT